MEKRRILLCEDDESLGNLIREYLQLHNFEVTFMPDGETGYQVFMNSSVHFDLCLLDVVMPYKDGFQLARDIRRVDTIVPIVFLTAKNLKEDVLEGFRIGADDYITKPFSMEELVMRLDAIIRRASGLDMSRRLAYRLGTIEYDAQRQELSTPEKKVKLTARANELLLVLVQNVNQLVERDYTLKLIWKESNYFNARSMDVYITRLRHTLSLDPSIEIINVHGKGYKLIVPNFSIHNL